MAASSASLIRIIPPFVVIARYYDPTRGTFLSPDTLVPDAGVLFDYNRFMYTRGNPLKYTDPTGHFTNDEITAHLKEKYPEHWQQYILVPKNKTTC
jgi:hypothetical protein